MGRPPLQAVRRETPIDLSDFRCAARAEALESGRAPSNNRAAPEARKCSPVGDAPPFSEHAPHRNAGPNRRKSTASPDSARRRARGDRASKNGGSRNPQDRRPCQTRPPKKAPARSGGIAACRESDRSKQPLET